MIDNFAGETSTIVIREGDTIIAHSNQITVDATASDVFSIDQNTLTITIKANTFTGNLTAIDVISAINGATINGVISDSNGTTGILELTGDFTESSVYWITYNEDSNSSYQTEQDGPLSVAIPAGLDSEPPRVDWVVSRAGQSKIVGSFDPTGGGVTSANVSPTTLTQPDGTTLYTGSSSSAVDVSFSGSICYIDINNFAVSAQAIIDKIEDALETRDGCNFLVDTGGSQSILAVIGGQTYLLLGTGYRLRRQREEYVNATVNAFVVSADGTPVDGTNGSVQLLQSLDSSSLTAEQVWSYLESENTISNSMKDILQKTRDHARATNMQTQETA